MCDRCIPIVMLLGPGVVHFEIHGIPHCAPDAWIVGRRQALERQGLSPNAAVVQACKEWVVIGEIASEAEP